ncbi:hypothetical protein FGO68_gene13393 [Halteria grandinella]|uniref:Uncharacterized protein n=1 Tax=Halteria grandinella TaxID=5974 RepID=A0A8J8NW55_HALGN|nr:hypothetical protein FGO68_gene13393 [Halteria grandinella]
MSFSKRDITSAMKVRWLMNQLMPSFSEMKTALQDYYVHEDDLIAYKLVLELYERFYLDCENPLEHTTAIRDQLFPFARFFYRTYIPSMPVSSFSEDDATLEKPTAFSSLHHASTYFHSLYPRLLNLQSVEDYQVYYEQRACEIENRIGSKRCQTGRHKVQKRDKYIM